MADPGSPRGLGKPNLMGRGLLTYCFGIFFLKTTCLHPVGSAMWHNVLTLFILIGWTLFSIYHIISLEPISKKTSDKFHLWTQYDFSVSDWRILAGNEKRIVQDGLNDIRLFVRVKVFAGMASVSLYICLLFVWFYKGQGNRGSEGLRASGPVQARSGPIHTKRKRKRSKYKPKDQRINYSFLWCLSLFSDLFCLSFGLFCFHCHFRLVWIDPYTASRIKVPVGYGQWSDTVTRRYVFITEHYVTEPNSFTLETITVPSLKPCRNCTIFWRVWE